jgi:hypothetical protein
MIPFDSPVRRRLAVTVVELVVVAVLFTLLTGTAIWLLTNSRRATQRLSTRTYAQQTTCRAIMRLLTELQEGMEVLSPAPGATLPYALVRDKLSLVRWYVLQAPGSPGTTALWRYTHDPACAPARRAERLVPNIRRLTFTSTSEGALQVNLVVQEEGQEFPLLTTVRMRNLASSEELW